jgi:hypothetical protein
MKTIEVKGKKVEIYDSIDELPIKRFHKFNKYMLVDSGIGSDINDINEHIAKISRYIDKADKLNAKTELENLRQSLYLISEGVNVKHLSFMVLIKSINGKEIVDISDEGMKKLLDYFGSLELNFFNRLIQSIKKKIEDELDVYFPGRFDDSSVKEYYDKLKHRTLLELDSLIRKKNNSDLIDKVDDYLLSLAKPKVFSGKESSEIKFDKQFEEMCLFLSKELSMDMNKTTVLQFYNAFDYIKKINKPNGKSNKL